MPSAPWAPPAGAQAGLVRMWRNYTAHRYLADLGNFHEKEGRQPPVSGNVIQTVALWEEPGDQVALGPNAGPVNNSLKSP